MTVLQIIQKLESFMKACGGQASDWYVGISHEAAARLQKHGAASDAVHAMWEVADCEEDARNIEKHLKACGMAGDTGGGKPSDPPNEVYVYKMTASTDP